VVAAPVGGVGVCRPGRGLPGRDVRPQFCVVGRVVFRRSVSVGFGVGVGVEFAHTVLVEKPEYERGDCRYHG